jgi:hypothetical protein
MCAATYAVADAIAGQRAYPCWLTTRPALVTDAARTRALTASRKQQPSASACTLYAYIPSAPLPTPHCLPLLPSTYAALPSAFALLALRCGMARAGCAWRRRCAYSRAAYATLHCYLALRLDKRRCRHHAVTWRPACAMAEDASVDSGTRLRYGGADARRGVMTRGAECADGRTGTCSAGSGSRDACRRREQPLYGEEGETVDASAGVWLTASSLHVSHISPALSLFVLPAPSCGIYLSS